MPFESRLLTNQEYRVSNFKAANSNCRTLGIKKMDINMHLNALKYIFDYGISIVP